MMQTTTHNEETTMVRIPTHAPPPHAGEILLEEFLEPLAWDLYHAQNAPEAQQVRKRIKRVAVNARFDNVRASA